MCLLLECFFRVFPGVSHECSLLGVRDEADPPSSEHMANFWFHLLDPTQYYVHSVKFHAKSENCIDFAFTPTQTVPLGLGPM